MGITSIQWTDHSANPIRARHKTTGKVGWHCVMTSPGCAHCYSQTLNGRFGTKLPFTQRSEEDVELFLDLKPMEALRRVRKPSKVFLCDMTDLFQDAVPFSWVDQIFSEIWAMKQHTFQVLTKRADRMAKYFESRTREMPWPLCNVWLGVSVEDQKRADERIPHLLQVPAAVRFLSVEPMLAPIDLEHAIPCGYYCDQEVGHVDHCLNGRIHWVICGGESGPHARPFDLAWARSIRDQCQAHSVPYFLKQLGSYPVEIAAPVEPPGRRFANLSDIARFMGAKIHLRDNKGGSMDEWPEDIQIREFPQPMKSGA